MERGLVERIKERTGLRTDRAAEAYAHFVHHAEFDRGIITGGDVSHEFYGQAKEEGNRGGENLINLGKGRYERWLARFRRLGLIAQTDFKDGSGSKYPLLVGYNYFNDPEVYVRYRKKGTDSWNGRITRCAKEEMARMSREGYEFA